MLYVEVAEKRPLSFFSTFHFQGSIFQTLPAFPPLFRRLNHHRTTRFHSSLAFLKLMRRPKSMPAIAR